MTRCVVLAGSAWLALAVVACSPGPTSHAVVAASTPREIAAETCPVDGFEAFIARFGSEIAFQHASTADPLIIEHYDTTTQPEPRRVTTRTPFSELSWPVMPRLDLLERQGREYGIQVLPDDVVAVKVFTPDTSDQQTYVFQRSPCWQLQRIVDDAI